MKKKKIVTLQDGSGRGFSSLSNDVIGREGFSAVKLYLRKRERERERERERGRES